MYYVLRGENVVEVDPETWAKQFKNGTPKIRQDHVYGTFLDRLLGKEKYFISTVFLGLGIDGDKGLFETMIFDAEGNDIDCCRHDTYKEAVKYHECKKRKYEQLC